MTTIQAIVATFGVELLPDTKLHHHRFHIKSSSSDALYVVSQKTSTGEWQCACPGWIYKKPGRERGCKHLTAMMPALMLISSTSAPAAEVSAPAALALAPAAAPKATKAKAPVAKPELVAATAVKSKAKTDREKVSDMLDQFRAFTLAEVDADQHLNYSSLQDFMLRAMMQFDSAQLKVKKSS